MKFIDSMNDFILDMYNMSDMIFILLLSLLVACIIIHQKKLRTHKLLINQLLSYQCLATLVPKFMLELGVKA